jgi:protein SCO1/2
MARNVSKSAAGRGATAAFFIFAALLPAHGAVSPQEYHKADVILPARAGIPTNTTVVDEAGSRRDLLALTSKPTVLVFADYTCRTLCGPIVAFVAAALERSRLRADEQYRLVVIGLDPRDGIASAAKMRRDHLGKDTALNQASLFVTTDQPAIDAVTSALGYRYVYDPEHDQFVHPGAAYVLRPNGRVARVLSGLGISGDDMRLALLEAGDGQATTWRDHVRLLCSGFDPALGTYNLMISRVLAASALATVVVLGGAISLLALAGRRRST